jgi:hypothetical protein
MSNYVAPLQDMQFVLKELAGLDQVAKLPGCEDASAELVDQILEESGRFCGEVLAPLNQSGDEEGSKWDKGRVTTPKGFIAAYKQFVEGGWNALQFPLEFGGQGLPKLVATPVMEMWKAANLSFSLCPLLTGGAIEALLLRGADALKKTYLPKMVEGAWTGTMNLTEPHCGTDLGLLRTKAVPNGDGTYRISGQKIFITYGEHDLAENIVHLVLARTPDAPAGVKGISLFVVPKFLVNADGSLGKRNDVHCASIEHKLGIHASPTAVLIYGERRRDRLCRRRGKPRPRVHVRHDERGALRRGLEASPFPTAPTSWRLRMPRNACRAAISRAAPRPCRSFATRRAPHADEHEGADRGDARARLCGGGVDGHRPLRSGRSRARQAPAFADMMIPVVKGWSTGPASSGVHRDSGARRHGLCRRNRRGAAPARCAHHHDLRRHHRDPGE